MTHELKIQKQWADAKLAGEKPFEIRRNDRGFQKGDIVHYTVVDPKTGEPWKKPSGEILYGNDDGRHPLEQSDFVITYVLEGADGLKKGYCVYADQPVPKRPVSADLGSGATPLNGTAEPLAPPPPLAETSGKEVHTDAESVPKEPAERKRPCRYAESDETHTHPVCRHKLCIHHGNGCMRDVGCREYEPAECKGFLKDVGGSCAYNVTKQSKKLCSNMASPNYLSRCPYE